MTNAGSRDGIALSRRAFAVGATATLASLAGCSALVDRIGDAVLEDVNMLNGTEQRVVGTLEITGPDGEVVLEESFDLPSESESESGDGNETDGNETDGEGAQVQGLYSDVWTDAGEYEVSVDLDEDHAIQDTASATETVSIDDPDEEMLVVLFGSEADDGPISFHVITALSELGEIEENASSGD